MSTQDGLPVESDEHGTLLSGEGLPARVTSAAWAALPPFPGWGVLMPATIPGPPLVAETSSESERVALLLSAYDTTLRRTLPGEFNPHSKHGVKAGDRKLLVAAAEALRRHEVSPLRWCEFSFDVWQHGRKQDAAEGKKERAARPALRVVFALKRIEETAGWARSEYERRGARLVMTRSQRSLVERHAAMMSAVLSGAVPASEAKEKFFPGDTYERLVEKARQDARREQSVIDTRVAAGEYLWE